MPKEKIKNLNKEEALFVLIEEAYELEKKLIKLELKFGFNPSQPRVSAGNPDGGRWSGNGNTGSARNNPNKPTLGRSRDHAETGEIMNDATNTPKPDLNAAVINLQKNAKPKSLSRCAEYVRRALNQSGFDVQLPQNSDKVKQAKDYGQPLLDAGFEEVADGGDEPANYPPVNYAPKAGDVVIIQPAKGHSSGHMAMYDGTRWISDWKQKLFWPGSTYLKQKPTYVIYRYPENP